LIVLIASWISSAAALPPRTWTDDTGKFPAKLGNARILANPATMLETRF